MSLTLLIKLQHLEIRRKTRYEYSYFSFSIDGEHHYFSSCFDQRSSNLSDDILIRVQGRLPDHIQMHRWENHTIMFTHQVDLTDLKTRVTVKKKHQTKYGEILSFMLILLQPEEIVFTNKFNDSISQHYLMVSNLSLVEKKTQERPDVGPSFFYLTTSHGDIAMPVTNGTMCVKLPDRLSFSYFKNGREEAHAGQIKSDDIQDKKMKLTLKGNNSKNYTLELNFMWVVNLYEAKIQNTLLLEAHEVYVYDFEVKFDNYNQFANCKLKIVYGNKAFEIGNEFNSPKPTKIKKIIHFIIKTEDQEITIIAQKNLKIVGHSKFYTDQLDSYQVNNPKRKIIDANNGKPLGTIKFKCQKGKNLSGPHNNKFWKQSNKKKLINHVLLSVEQFSVNYERDEDLSVVVKTQTEEKIYPNVPNLQYFHSDREISYSPVTLTVRPDESVYMMVKKTSSNQSEIDINQTDFIGIAIINFNELLLGINTAEIPFFKNQQKTAMLNCLINKVTPYPFVKANFQPQLLTNSHQKSLSIAVFMKKIVFTPYYYTYRYENKNEVYCIVEVNRVKKVLIMEHSNHDKLTFVTSAGSDTLNFLVDFSEYIKVKITFLVSDIGQDEEIYGYTTLKMKINELSTKDLITFDNVELKNDFGTEVGIISTEVSRQSQAPKKQFVDEFEEKHMERSRVQVERKQIKSNKGPFKSQLRKVNKDIEMVNESLERVEKSLEKKRYKRSVNPIRNMISNNEINQSMEVRKQKHIIHKDNIRYDNNKVYGNPNRYKNNKSNGNVKLPDIRKNKGSLQDLIQRMKIRKRTGRGNYEGMQKGIASQRARKKQPYIPNNERSLTEKEDYEIKDKQIQMKIHKYQEELKELKDDLKKEEVEEPPKRDLNSVEWEDNEFANPNVPAQQK